MRKIFYTSFLFACFLSVGFPVAAQAINFTAGENAATIDSSRTRGITLGDFSGDGKLDIYVGNRSEPNQVWLSGTSGDYVELQIVGDTTGLTHAVLSGDIDGDGDIDLYAINAGGGAQNKLWINAGSGSFGNADIVGDTNNAYGGAIGDVDGDGDLDIYVANLLGSQNNLWINDGTGSFSDGNIIGDTGNSTDAIMVDVDGDGDLDIYTANYGQNKLWINDGTGSFIDSDITGDTSDTYGVAFGDVDGDGDNDLYTANDSGQQNQLWVNDGTGSFTANNITGDTGISRKAIFGDLDGDGHDDLYVANNGQNKLWINDGTGSFTNDDISGDTKDSHAIVLYDYNADGNLDIFVGNEADQNQLWLYEIEEVGANSSVSQKGGRRIRYVCKDSKAYNYNPTRFARGDNSLCQYVLTGFSDGVNNDCKGGANNCGDGPPNSFSESEVTLNNPATGKKVSLISVGEYCKNITKADIVIESSLGSRDAEHMYPFGLVDFDIACDEPGQSADIIIVYSKKYNTENWVYRKFNPKTKKYTDVTDHVIFGQQIVENRLVTTVSYTITDGDNIFDTDGEVNGVIQDPSGPALLVSALPFANIDTDGVIYLCKDPRARNYTLANIGQHSAEVCTFDTDLVVGITITPSPRCEQGFTLTEDLSKGLSDGVLHKGKIVSQVAQLQLHINRLLNQYELPAGLVDGVFGVHTQRGVELLQGFLNDVIYPSPQLAIDGIVGKNTRTAINASCPAVEV